MQRTLVEHVSQQFRAEPRAADAARRVVERLESELGHERCRAACLLVTELVANAVVHGSRGPQDMVTVRVCKSPWGVRVGVIDAGPGFEPCPREDHEAGLPESGWGLYLVEQMADRWGVEPGPDREVWFEFDVSPRGETL
jgi:anti-sigma regulatory factor (Ser/Thr protein kinase)